jgi:putative ABC transport system substrate-binding protein
VKRRAFIALLGSTAATWPLAVRAQQPARMRRVGVLMSLAADDPEGQSRLTAFAQGLQKLGWTEGRNVRNDYRWAAGDPQSMQRFGKELVALQPDLILSHTTPTTAALLQQTRTIPIIFANVADPVGSGFAASLPRPGGNVTGFATAEGSLGGKWLELIKEIAPRVNRVAMLFNPATATYAEYYLNPFKAAAPSFAVEAIAAPVHNTSELESVVTAQAREPNSGLILMPGDFAIANRVLITSLAARYRLPTAYPFRFFAGLGGLLTYGVDLTDNFRRAAFYADRILNGHGGKRNPRCKAGDIGRPDHLRAVFGPGWQRPGCKPSATGRQRHRPVEPAHRYCRQAARTIARGCTRSSSVSDHGQCQLPRCRAGDARGSGN